MKLLFDQNLSSKLVESLSDIFPNSKHAKMLDLEETDDRKIWNIAKKNNYMIVSKDSDFHQLSFLYGTPPKVVWISKGNCSTYEIEMALRKARKDLEEFTKNPKASFLEIS